MKITKSTNIEAFLIYYFFKKGVLVQKQNEEPKLKKIVDAVA